jgi:hypothetical protein
MRAGRPPHGRACAGGQAGFRRAHRGIRFVPPFPLGEPPQPVLIGARDRPGREIEPARHLGLSRGERRHIAELAPSVRHDE